MLDLPPSLPSNHWCAGTTTCRRRRRSGRRARTWRARPSSPWVPPPRAPEVRQPVVFTCFHAGLQAVGVRSHAVALLAPCAAPGPLPPAGSTLNPAHAAPAARRRRAGRQQPAQDVCLGPGGRDHGHGRQEQGAPGALWICRCDNLWQPRQRAADALSGLHRSSRPAPLDGRR